uniref:hypothetical protein n=1 Tax=Ruminococcus bromii TaxID=40518 RepID=UPI003FF0C2FE
PHAHPTPSPTTKHPPPPPIESITRYQILLSGGMKIPVSKLRYTDVQKALIESAAEKIYKNEQSSVRLRSFVR